MPKTPSPLPPTKRRPRSGTFPSALFNVYAGITLPRTSQVPRVSVDRAVGGETDGADRADVVQREAAAVPREGHPGFRDRHALALDERRDAAERADAEDLGEHGGAHDLEVAEHELTGERRERPALVGRRLERERPPDDLLEPDDGLEQAAGLARRHRHAPPAGAGREGRLEVAARGRACPRA